MGGSERDLWRIEAFLAVAIAVLLTASVAIPQHQSEVPGELRHAAVFAVVGAFLLWVVWPTPPEVPEPSSPFDKHLCPRCLQPNRTTRHLCRRCGAPVSALATMLPFESARAEGWALGEAARTPRPATVVALGGIGALLPYAANLLHVPVLLGDRHFTWSHPLEATLDAVIGLLGAYAAGLCAVHWVRRGPPPPTDGADEPGP